MNRIDEIYRCKAQAKSTTERCKRAAIPGGRVCVKHGGGAPQVREAAEARIQALVDPAINRIGNLIDFGENDSVRLAASKDALDRAGYKPTEKRETKVEGSVSLDGLREALGVATDA